MLKTQINNYISKKDVFFIGDKSKVINQILSVYKFLHKDLYLLMLFNNIKSLIINTGMFPITNNDPEGLALVKKIEIAMNEDRQETIKFLNDIPMYFLLSILGRAHYHEQEKLNAIIRHEKKSRKNKI